MSKLTPETRDKLKGVSTATLGSALYKRGLRNQMIQDVRPLSAPKGGSMVGEAYTLRYMPAREDLNPMTVFRDHSHPQRRAVEECPPGAILVMDSRKDARAASAGGILVYGTATGLNCGGCLVFTWFPSTWASGDEVLSADGTKSYSIFPTRSIVRPDPPAEPELRFMETAAGTPPAVKVWWHPGETTGQEFIYPKDQAQRLAKNAKEPVLTTQAPSSTTAQTNTKNLARVSPSGADTDVKRNGNDAATNATGDVLKGEQAPASLKITVTIPGGPGR